MDRRFDNRGIDDLSLLGQVALGFEHIGEAVEQALHQPEFLEPLAKQPHRLRIRHPVLDLQAQKAHEREPVPDLVLNLIVGQVVQRLQDQDLEHQQGIIGLAPGVGLALFLVHRLQHGDKLLPRDRTLQVLKWIAQLAQLREAFVDIEEAWMHH